VPEAVGAYCADYLVKGQVDGSLLNRVIHYAVERRRSEEMQQQLREAQIYARENARLNGAAAAAAAGRRAADGRHRYRPAAARCCSAGLFDLVEGATAGCTWWS
jgi:hypothetical protein